MLTGGRRYFQRYHEVQEGGDRWRRFQSIHHGTLARIQSRSTAGKERLDDATSSSAFKPKLPPGTL